MRGKKWKGICSVEGCGKKIKALGLCQNHYTRQWMYGYTDKVNTGLKRKHPLYSLWFERKQLDALESEWIDFWAFVEGVGKKPGPNFSLVRITEGKYGPHNFKWQEHLVRRDGETQKQWYARKWQSRKTNFPTFDTERKMVKNFGITLDEYNKQLTMQNFVCAICEQPETSFEFKSGNQRRLSIDHNHKTGKLRELLCFRCNSTIGRIGEDYKLLQSMADYLKKHEGAVNG